MRKQNEPVSNKEWQQEFEKLKASTKQSGAKLMELPIVPIEINGITTNHFHYDGETNYGMYCTFINDVLSFLRDGEDDFVFYPYQIIDLLQFEHDMLCSEYLPEEHCFRVWLMEKEG